MIALRIKAAVVGSPFHRIAQGFRWLAKFPQRYRHPEMWEVYLEERRLPSVLRRLLKPDSNGVDVGCHIGSFLHLLNSIAPNGEHTAIEPSEMKGQWLARKFPKTHILNIAVADFTGRSTFEENTSRPGLSKLNDQVVPGKNYNNYYEVDVERLDDILTERVDFIKIDIEGGELSALRGAEKTIERSRCPILFECGSEYNKDKPSRRDLYDFLIDRGYKIFTFGDFLFDKGPMEFDEFRRCGLYPFRAFNFIALHRA